MLDADGCIVAGKLSRQACATKLATRAEFKDEAANAASVARAAAYAADPATLVLFNTRFNVEAWKATFLSDDEIVAAIKAADPTVVDVVMVEADATALLHAARARCAAAASRVALECIALQEDAKDKAAAAAAAHNATKLKTALGLKRALDAGLADARAR